MSFTLSSSIDDTFDYEGEILNINMNFDNILLLFEMFDDDTLTDADKIDIALDMLVIESDKLKFSSFEEMVEFFNYVMKEFLEIDLNKKKQKNGNKDQDGEEEEPEKFMDYQKDADIIYASFMAAYRIDLFEMQGKLHWKKFKALISHLSDDSKLKQVIGYRTAKIPTGKNVNKDHVDHIKKMKRVYSLEDEKENERRAQESSKALNIMGEALKERALKNKR
jgi:hypothetical protein